MQTNSIKAIKDYLKFYFASQEFVYLPPQKILAKTPNDTIAQDTAKNTSLKKSPSEFQPRQTAVATQKKVEDFTPSVNPAAIKEFLQKTANLQEAGSLDSLRLRIQDCQKCNLCLGRKNIVYGQGNQKAQILFIGEGPGMQEDQQGLPFVGKAGQLLNQMLLSIALTRESIYITNLVKCRPPNNRNPEKEEIKTCSEILNRKSRKGYLFFL